MWREEIQNETRRFFAETFALLARLNFALLYSTQFPLYGKGRKVGEGVAGGSHTPPSKVESFGNPLNMPRPVGLVAF